MNETKQKSNTLTLEELNVMREQLSQLQQNKVKVVTDRDKLEGMLKEIAKHITLVEKIIEQNS